MLQVFGKLDTSLGGNIASFIVASERGNFRRTNGAHTRQGSDTATQLVDQRDGALRAVAIECRRDRKGNHIFGSEPEIDVAQVPQGAYKQHRSSEKQRGESNLSCN